MLEIGEPSNKGDVKKQSLVRCMDWLQKQNSLESKKLSIQNDIQFIVQTNADRTNFLVQAADDEATVPAGVDEESVIVPKAVAIHRLRFDGLQMECEWHSCRNCFDNYKKFQQHVKMHISEVQVIQSENCTEFVCLWDVCGFKTTHFKEIVRHINYHAYHAKLLAVGLNARASLKLTSCNKESSQRNQLPQLPKDHQCMWTGCMQEFNSMQHFLDHVKLHVLGATSFICSWAGCGSQYHRRVLLTTHLRFHTGERLIACYHCGRHFSSNTKLSDHLARQNVTTTAYTCSICGISVATASLLSQHERQHVSAYACSFCDMSAPTPATLTNHIRFRHLPKDITRTHECGMCPYKAVTRHDLRRHMSRHTRKRKKEDDSDEENNAQEKKPPRKYICHLCEGKELRVFPFGKRLTKHLVNSHGAQWQRGHSRFTYKQSEDGMYRLTTTRLEFLDVSRKIVDGYTETKESLSNNLQYKLERKAEATYTTPTIYEVKVMGEEDSNRNTDGEKETGNDSKEVEIMMCDVDEHGNIINSEVISDVVYS